MIAFWMLWSIWMSGLVGAAAVGAERVMASRGGARRVVWATALGLIMVVVVGGIIAIGGSRTDLSTPGAASSRFDRVPGATPAGLDAHARRSTTRLDTARDAWIARLTRFDPALVVTWAAASAALLVHLSCTAERLRRRRRRWQRSRVYGVDVLVTDDIGPAVIGLRRPAIAIPRWALDYDDALRALVLAHEREHIAARDSLVVATAWVVAIALPWNPVTWWALARLRRAIEVDCDARVLRRTADTSVYRLLLLDVALRQAMARSGVSSLAPGFVPTRIRKSDLEHRLVALGGRSAPDRRGSAALALTVAVVAFVVGCETPAPSVPDTRRAAPFTLTSGDPAMSWSEQIVRRLRRRAIDLVFRHVEVFDEAAMRRTYGVSKMPEPQFDAQQAEQEIRRELALVAPGHPVSDHVAIALDIDATGTVTDARAVDPAPPPKGVSVFAVFVDTDGDVERVRRASADRPADHALKRAAERTLLRLARFTPAELDGRPVPFRGYRLRFEFD